MKGLVWYEDKISGKESKRPGLDALRKEIFAGKIKTVIVWKLDRLARSKRDGETILADWCGRNVRVVSVTQAIDLSGIVGQIVASVLLGLAEIELVNIASARRPESSEAWRNCQLNGSFCADGEEVFGKDTDPERMQPLSGFKTTFQLRCRNSPAGKPLRQPDIARQAIEREL